MVILDKGCTISLFLLPDRIFDYSSNISVIFVLVHPFLYSYLVFVRKKVHENYDKNCLAMK